MKKTICAVLFAALASVAVFSGCSSDDKYYSLYQIEAYFPEAALIEEIPADQRSEQDKQDLIAMSVMVEYLINNLYVRTNTYNGAIYYEGKDEEFNDEQAIRFYEGKTASLEAENLDEVMQREKAKEGTELTGSGSFSFTYRMRKGTAASLMPGTSSSFTVNY